MPHYVSLDGIRGGSTAPGHEEWIEILAFNVGIARDTSHGGGGGAGKVSVQDINFIKSVDKSTPLLHQSIANGDHHGTATLHCTRVDSTGQETTYYVIEMKKVLVTSFSNSGDSESVPTEQVSMNFEKMTVRYVEQGR